MDFLEGECIRLGELNHVTGRTLKWISSNHPELEHLNMDCSDAISYVSWGTVGSFIKDNTSMHAFHVKNYAGDAAKDDEWDALFTGVSQSRSITQFILSRCHLAGPLLKLFDTCNLLKVRLFHCTLPYPTVSVAQRISHLCHIEIFDCHFADDANGASEFISSLNHNHKLKSLVLSQISIGKNGCVAVEGILLNPYSIINTLELKDVGACDEALFFMSNGLESCSSLQTLSLERSNISRRGWRVLSSVLSSPNTTINNLILTKCTIDDDSAIVLASGLTCNTTVEKLDLVMVEEITSAGWLALFVAMQNPRLQLKQVLLGYNDSINDEVVLALSDIIRTKKDTIKELNLECCDSITSAGWIVLSSVFLTPIDASIPALKHLHIGNDDFNDDALVALNAGFLNMPTLATLELAAAPSLTHAGWEAVSELLQKAHVFKISAQTGVINDKAVGILVRGLKNNFSLYELDIGYDQEISAAGWELFASALCDTSSAQAIQNSNHCIRKIAFSNDYKHPLPDIIHELLEANRIVEDLEVVRLKMARYYGGTKIDLFVEHDREMPYLHIKLIPFVLYWIGKEHRQTSLYRFLRNEASSLFK